MYQGTATNLLNKTPADVKLWLDSFDSVLTDCDGVLWLYNDIIAGSDKVINKFKDMGKKVFFITNNSTKTRPEFLEKSTRLGFNMREEEIISTAYTAAAYLKNRSFDKKVYVIGSSGITKELDAVGIAHSDIGPDILENNLNNFINTQYKPDPDIGAVIVGFDEHFSFPKMIKAASYLNNPDCLFVATNTDERFPLPEYVVPGTGSIVRAIETCAERDAVVIGKPDPYICETLLKNKIIDPPRTLMIGDRCNTDILLGKNCGFQTLLVGTGIHNLNDIERWSKSNSDDDKKLIPDVFLPSLADLLKFM